MKVCIDCGRIIWKKNEREQLTNRPAIDSLDEKIEDVHCGCKNVKKGEKNVNNNL